MRILINRLSFFNCFLSFEGEENIIYIYTTFPLFRILLLHKWCNNVLRQLFPLPKKPLHIYLQYERIGLFRYEFSSLVLYLYVSSCVYIYMIYLHGVVLTSRKSQFCAVNKWIYRTFWACNISSILALTIRAILEHINKTPMKKKTTKL